MATRNPRWDTARYKAYQAGWQRRAYAAARREGKCTRCGEPSDCSRCAECLQYAKERSVYVDAPDTA